MKTIISAAISLVPFIGVLSMLQYTNLNVFALSAYQLGFQHGVTDGKDSCLHTDGCDWYILKPDKGFAFHLWDFVRGYVTGFCKTSSGTSSDADQASLGL
jgi:hypothetical protein